jgi:CRISPR-associated protein Cas1
MIKRTLYFGNPAYLSTKMEQLEVKLPDQNEIRKIPIEDIGVMILDHAQITITQSVIAKLLENNVALITCNSQHHPTGLLLNLDGHSKQSKRFKHQLEASDPLKKQLWQQTISAKIENQAKILETIGENANFLKALSKTVKSGDTSNCEAQAASYYWKSLTPALCEGKFKRERFGEPPNHLLNYGYAILRALIARNLVGSGLLPTLGIFHRNQYNAYCLADDIMEPYRPFVDLCVLDIVNNNEITDELTPDLKKQLLQIPVFDVLMNDKTSPLMVATQETTASLAKCFEGTAKKIKYPSFQ